MKLPKAVQNAIASDPHLVEHFRNRVIEDLDDLYQSLRDQAVGYYVRETTDDGEERVYRKEPSFHAASYLVNHAVGAPTKKVETKHQHTFSYEGRLEELKAEREQARALPKPGGIAPNAPETPHLGVVDGDFRQIPGESVGSDGAEGRLEALRERFLAQKRAEAGE